MVGRLLQNKNGTWVILPQEHSKVKNFLSKIYGPTLGTSQSRIILNLQ
jgi:hypothetical protein